MIEKCCICGSDVRTEKILPYRNLLGSTTEIYNMHIAHCDNCGFIFLKNPPFTPEKLENRYKNEAATEIHSSNFILNGNDDYVARCHRQKHFIDENLASVSHSNGGGV